MNLAYDVSLEPPAPFVPIRVSLPLEPATARTLQAQVDTAADISCIPMAVVDQLGLQPTRTIHVEGYDGTRAEVTTYSIVLNVADARFRLVEVVPIPEDYALLGRDVLNSLYLRLNGPELTFHIGASL